MRACLDEHELVLAFAYRLIGHVEGEGLGTAVHMLYKQNPRASAFSKGSLETSTRLLKHENVIDFGKKQHPEIDSMVTTDELLFSLC